MEETGEGSVTFDGLENGTTGYVITGLRHSFAHRTNYLVPLETIHNPA